MSSLEASGTFQNCYSRTFGGIQCSITGVQKATSLKSIYTMSKGCWKKGKTCRPVQKGKSHKTQQSPKTKGKAKKLFKTRVVRKPDVRTIADLRCPENPNIFFFRELKALIRSKYCGQLFKDVQYDPLFIEKLHQLRIKYNANHITNKQVRDQFSSVKRELGRILNGNVPRRLQQGRKEPQPGDFTDLFSDEELKQPEIDSMNTRSKMCLPHPGLVPSQAKPRNFSLLREDHTKHSFPMYLEKDLSFAHQLSNMLALYKPKVSDEEIDYYTSESICDYWKKERFERVEGLLTLFSRAPYFHDEFDIDHVDGVRTVTFTFSWRTICQIARKEGMPPFDMLAYVSLVQYGRESGEDYEKLRQIVGQNDWYDHIPENIDCIELPDTCPLKYCLFAPHMKLRAQVKTVRALYERFPFLPNFGGSHAIFLECALKDYYSISFDAAAGHLDVSKIPELENEYFTTLETASSNHFLPYSMQEPIRGIVPVNLARDRVYVPFLNDEQEQDGPPMNAAFGEVRDHDVDQLVDINDLPIFFISDLVAPEDNMIQTPNSCSTTSY